MGVNKHFALKSQTVTMFHKESDFDTFIAMTTTLIESKNMHLFSTLHEVYGNNYLVAFVAFCSTVQKHYKKNSFLNLARYTEFNKNCKHHGMILCNGTNFTTILTKFLNLPKQGKNLAKFFLILGKIVRVDTVLSRYWHDFIEFCHEFNTV